MLATRVLACSVIRVTCRTADGRVKRCQQEQCRLPDDGPVDTALTGTITFLFTDLEGSTRLWEQFPEAMKVALGRHDAILRAAIEASAGPWSRPPATG